MFLPIKYLNLSLNSEFSKKLQKRFAKRLYTFIPKHLNFKNIYILEEGTFAFIKYHMQDNNEDLNQEIKDYQKRINHEKITNDTFFNHHIKRASDHT